MTSMVMTATQLEDPRPGCAEANLFSYLTFGYINPVVEKGRNEQIGPADAPKLSPEEDTARNTHKLLDNLESCERALWSHPLLRSVFLAFWPTLLTLEGLLVISHFLGLLGPLLLQQVLLFQEAQNAGRVTQEEAHAGMSAVGVLVMLGLFMIFWNSQVAFLQSRLEVRITGALRGAVVQRSVQGKPQGASAAPKPGDDSPTVYNVISFDVPPNVTILWVILGAWIFPIQLVSTLAVLFHQVGWAIVPGTCVVIVAKFVVGCLLLCDGYYRHQQLQAKDRRLGLCNEGFSNIRTLQMLTWVQPFEDRITAARAEELRLQRTRLWLQKMSAALDYSLAVIVTLVTLGYFVIAERGEMNASTAIPVIGLVTMLIGPFGKIPQWINDYLVWKSAYQRLSDFLGLSISPSRRRAASASPPPPPSPPGAGKGEVAQYQCCTLSWSAPGDPPAPSDEDGSLAEADVFGKAEEEGECEALLDQEGFQLQELDLRLRAGQVLAVVGNEGQGKTSVLQGLLGEMAVQSGLVRSAAVERRAVEARAGAHTRVLPATSCQVRELLACRAAGDGSQSTDEHVVPYAPQEVMLMSGTVRWNILFGARYEPSLYRRTLQACALATDLSTMPDGDLTEVAQGGATLSGGQRARVGLARAVYQASLALRDRPESPLLVLLDDVLCALDRRVAGEVTRALLAPGGMLSECGVVIATADPWWLDIVAGESGERLQVALLRGGRVVALGSSSHLRGCGFSEIDDAGSPVPPSSGADAPQGGLPTLPEERNPQEDSQSDEAVENLKLDKPTKSDSDNIIRTDSQAQECLLKRGDMKGSKLQLARKSSSGVLQAEGREEGAVRWATYKSYFMAVGPWTLTVLCFALSGIMLFQNCCNLWIAYWTSEDKSSASVHGWVHLFLNHEPTSPRQYLVIYATFVVLFAICNFAGHAVEIVGGIGAARKIFSDALSGTLERPFRWWDTNPPGRVLNRFSEDVNVMDLAITNIMGVIFGAALYFVSHLLVLTLANPYSLILLPFIAFALEFFAKYYRTTVREVQRLYLVSMSAVYQEMVEAVIGQVTIRAFAAVQQVLCSSMDGLDRLQRMNFAKICVVAWIGLRMEFIGYSLNIFNMLYPVLQYFGILRPHSAALVGFSISYSQDVVGILKQMILNFSELEMQLISVERLREYSQKDRKSQPPALHAMVESSSRGLELSDVAVTYREGLPPALSGVSLFFPLGEAAAIMGRTGAGKSSLLLSVMQLVPYTGTISVCGERLGCLDGEDVRSRLVGVVPQQPALFDGSLRFNLDPKGQHSDSEIWEALGAVGLRAACSGGAGLEAPVAAVGGDSSRLAFSQGQRQMLCAARALLRRPRVAMLDEVTASLPSEVASSTVETLFATFKGHGAAVLLVTHQQELLPLCDRVVTVAGGRVVGDRRNTD